METIGRIGFRHGYAICITGIILLEGMLLAIRQTFMLPSTK